MTVAQVHRQFKRSPQVLGLDGLVGRGGVEGEAHERPGEGGVCGRAIPLGLWPVSAHGSPVAGYPLPSARATGRAAWAGSPFRSGHARASRRSPRSPGSARPGFRASVFPLDSRLRSAGYSHPTREEASRKFWHPQVGPAGPEEAPPNPAPERQIPITQIPVANSHHQMETGHRREGDTHEDSRLDPGDRHPIS